MKFSGLHLFMKMHGRKENQLAGQQDNASHCHKKKGFVEEYNGRWVPYCRPYGNE
jgi:hypothetical protein